MLRMEVHIHDIWTLIKQPNHIFWKNIRWVCTGRISWTKRGHQLHILSNVNMKGTTLIFLVFSIFGPFLRFHIGFDPSHSQYELKYCYTLEKWSFSLYFIFFTILLLLLILIKKFLGYQNTENHKVCYYLWKLN